MAFQPTASLETLKKRAALLAQIRAFFLARDVIESDVPALGLATVTDPFVASLSLSAPSLYLQTSPEFYLKRLLAAGMGDLFYLGSAFRKDEHGRSHRTEFKMLEWYRLGFSDDDLIADVQDLIGFLRPGIAFEVAEYGRLFNDCLGLCPHRATVDALRALAKSHCDIQFDSELKSVWLDFLFSQLVEPTLGVAPVFVKHFPVELGALARHAEDDQGQQVAKRFELYWQGRELANGYWELVDAEEQRRRFAADNQQRTALGLPQIAPDAQFLAALDAGLPDCAGVALGVDRLLMCLLEQPDIAQVMPFADF